MKESETLQKEYEAKLSEKDNWKYDDSEFRFSYKPDTNYCMDIKDSINKKLVESYSLSQQEKSVIPATLEIKYRNSLLKKIPVAFLDDSRFLTVRPLKDSLGQKSIEDGLSFRFLLRNSLEYYIEELFFYMNNGFCYAADSGQKNQLLRDIVIFEDEKQKNKIVKELKNKLPEIQEVIQPEDWEVKEYNMIIDQFFTEEKKNNIVNLCKEKNLSEYINKYYIKK